jgi:hypothetical protein
MVARIRILIATALMVSASAVAVSADPPSRPRPSIFAPPARGAAAEPGSQQSVVSRDADEPRGKKNGDEVTGPMAVFDDIENAWRAGSVDPILRHFGSRKVALSIDGTAAPGGSFSRNQSYYVFKDLFRLTVTRKFEFVQFRQLSEAGSESFAIAERHYQRRDDGRLVKDKVYVSLHPERDGDRERWVVDEIKSIR